MARIYRSPSLPYKVDREERPDLDAVYMAVCQAAYGTGRLALDPCFDAPEQKPFFAASYLPKNSRYGVVALWNCFWKSRANGRQKKKSCKKGPVEITAFLKEHAGRASVPKSPPRRWRTRAVALVFPAF